MREQREEVVAPNPIEVLDNLDADLDRIELWTAALSCFQHPAPEYLPDNVRSDEREGTVRSMPGEARDRTVENQPYTAVTIALGLGWLLGRTRRPL